MHKQLLRYNLHGGKNISKEFPELGETALYCVTEITSKIDIDKLVDAFAEILWEGEG